MRCFTNFSMTKFFIVFLSVVLISACGGGGGGDTGGGTDTGGGSGSDVPDQQVDFSTQSDAEITNTAQFVFDVGAQTHAIPAKGTVTNGQPVAGVCNNVGGTYDIPVILDPGYGNYVFVNCEFVPGLFLDGDLVKAVSNIANFDTQYSYNAFSIDDGTSKLTVTGDLYEASSTVGGFEIGSISNNGGILQVGIVSTQYTDTLQLVNFSESHSDDLNNNVLSYDFSYTVNSVKLGGSVTVNTSTTIEHNYNLDPYPYAGVYEVTGLGGGNVRVTVLGSGQPNGLVRVDIDKDGDSIYETSNTITWSVFTA